MAARRANQRGTLRGIQVGAGTWTAQAVGLTRAAGTSCVCTVTNEKGRADVLLTVLAAAVGVLIGLAGVGGVLLPPTLVAVGNMDGHEASATSMWALLFTGTIGTVACARSRLVPWGMLARLAVGTVPMAFVGARANALLPAPAVLLGLGVLTLAVGIYQLLPRPERTAPRQFGSGLLVLIGAGVGFGSAVTGTGGPVLLVPALLALGIAPLTAVAVSQAAQLLVVVPASAGYLMAGAADLRVGTLLGTVAAGGALIGVRFAIRVSADRLRGIVALICVAAGAFLVLRTVAGFP